MPGHAGLGDRPKGDARMIDERLRLATAMVHSIPGATLRVGNGVQSVVIGAHPAADLSPCRWRGMLTSADLSGGIGAWADCRLLAVGGVLERTRSGMFVDRSDPGCRWAAFRLPPCVAFDVLKQTPLDPLPDDAVTATVRPDPELGVTIIGIGVDAPGMADVLEDLAASVYASLSVAELTMSIPVVEG